MVDLFDLGRLEERGPETVLVPRAEEVGTLKTVADAYGFDCEEGFIEMCLALTRFADQLIGGHGGGEVRFTAISEPLPRLPRPPGGAAAPEYSPERGHD